MLIENDSLRKIAPTFERLGRSLIKNTTENATIELAGELLETAAIFRTLPEDDFLVSGDYTNERAHLFADNFLYLLKVAKAGMCKEHRATDLLQSVGTAADKANLNADCALAAATLTPIVNELL